MVLDRVTARISKTALLRDISLNLAPDEQWAVVGANASGKSALGRLLCGELAVVSGRISGALRAEFVAFETVDEILAWERYNDDSDFLDRLDHGTPVREFLLADRPQEASRLAELAKRLDFTGLLERGVRFLSTGEMRKVVICRALLRDPQLLVLDEPFDGLDRDSCRVLRELIGACMGQGIRILLLLNRFSEIVPQITHIAYLRDCALVTAGPRAELLDSAPLRRLHAFHYSLPAQLPERDPAQPDFSLPVGEPLIAMRKVTVGYSGKAVLRDLDWTVEPGQHWQISGPNGAGKSTLLSLVAGDHPQAYANDIRLFGRQRGSGESVWQIKQRLGLLSTALQQNYRVGVTAEMAVISGFFDSIGVYREASRSQRQIAREWLRLLHLDERGRAPLRSLSYGEQRLILLARAMVKQPPLLILDEPCQGLDEINRQMVLKLVDHLARVGDTQLLYVTHHAEDRLASITHHLQLVPAAEGGFTGRIKAL
ncbi:MAG: molybdate ABC transporter ATP-binding protein ModF [Syntrophotaleaceae bacterium]